MKKIIAYILFLISATAFVSCDTTEPDIKPPVEPDSTTQNFTFETFEFGNGFESSWLNDVWIFDENNIWAVGYVREQVSNDLPVNIVRWNGNNWAGFGPQFNSAGIYGIWAIDSSNILFAVGAVVQYKNGNFTEFNLGSLGFTQGQGVHKLWGSSENNIWGVGPNSTIVHYDGIAWSKIAFDDGWRFDAITGSKQTGIAYASATSQQFNTIIVELKNNSATVIYNSANDPNNLTAYNLRMISDSVIFLSNQQIWKINIENNKTDVIGQLPGGYYLPLIGFANKIDIYFFGSKYQMGDHMVHYNGKRLQEYPLFGRTGTIYGEAFAIKDLAVMTGFSNNKGYLVKVKRVK